MSLLSNTILAFSMSADAFAASLGKGARLKRPRLPDAVRVGFIFGSIETLTPMIGWGMGTLASHYIEAVDHWIAFAILSGIGAKMIYEGLHEADEEQRSGSSLWMLILTAIGTSIDSMAVGVTLALVGTDIWVIALAIGGATWLMATLGFMTGHYIGTKAGKIAEMLGGACLIAIGTRILFQHLGYL